MNIPIPRAGAAVLRYTRETPEQLLARYRAYHRARPEIYEAFVAVVRERRQELRLQSGRKWSPKVSGIAVLAIVREQLGLRISNAVAPLYVRLAGLQYPDLQHTFERRRSQLDNITDEALMTLLE